MKRLLMTTAGAFALAVAAQPALAVDKAPLFNWSGLYAGGNIGYGWGRNTGAGWDSFTDPVGPAGAFGAPGYFAAGGNVLPGVKPEGVIGGVQIGYDWQYSPHWVAGLVADIQASDMSDSASVTVEPPGRTLSTQSNSAKIRWFGTVRAKLGYAADNWLLYVTGGLAYGKVKTHVVMDCFACVPPHLYAGSSSRTKAGWTAGAGLEYGLSPNWSLGLEYLYVDLGKGSTTATHVLGGVATVTTFTAESKLATHIVRAALNYRFASGMTIY